MSMFSQFITEEDERRNSNSAFGQFINSNDQPSFQGSKPQGNMFGASPFNASSPLLLTDGSNRVPMTSDMVTTHHHKYSQVYIQSLFLQRMEGFPEFQSRPYEMTVDAASVNHLQAHLDQVGGLVNTATMASVVPRLMHVGDATGHVMPVRGGWAATRYRFVLIVKFVPKNLSGVVEFSVITGYTTHYEAPTLISNYVDPNMVLVVSQVQRFVVNKLTNEPVGNFEHARVLSKEGDPDGYSGADRRLIRPGDCATHMDSYANLTSMASQYGFSAETKLFNTSSALQMVPAGCSEPLHTTTGWATNFLRGVVSATSAHRTGSFLSGVGDGEDANTNPGALTRSIIGPDQITSDPFLQLLATLSDSRVVPSSFTIQMLKNFDPSVGGRIETSLIANQDYGMVTGNFDGENPNGNDEAARISFAIAQGIGTHMVNTALGYVEFAWMSGQDPVITDAKSLIDGYNFSPLLQSFVTAMPSQLLVPCSYMPGGYNQHYVNCSVRADLLGRTVVNIALDGASNFCSYVYPTNMGERTSSCIAPTMNYAGNFYGSSAALANSIFGE